MSRVKSATTGVSISEVAESIFSQKYSAQCLSCQFCHDACCRYGCDVDGAEVARIMTYQKELEILLKIPAALWFRERKRKDTDYPSGEFRRTQTYHDRCVFYTAEPRGCALHCFALKKGLDPHQLKPMVCFLFPITWEQGRLFLNSLFEELPCKNQGRVIFEAQKPELRVYFGREFVSELEKMAPQNR